jgi:hypothetical protein
MEVEIVTNDAILSRQSGRTKDVQRIGATRLKTVKRAGREKHQVAHGRERSERQLGQSRIHNVLMFENEGGGRRCGQSLMFAVAKARGSAGTTAPGVRQ